MQPINLRPLLNSLIVIDNNKLTFDEIKFRINASTQRTKDIIKLLKTIKLIEVNDKTKLTKKGIQINNLIKNNDWIKVNDYLYDAYEPYKRLIKIIEQYYDEEKEMGISYDKIQDFERIMIVNKDPLLKNDVIKNFLIDWGERLGKISDNKLINEKRYYVVKEKSYLDLQSLLTIYIKFAGTGLGAKRYLEIPYFREVTCETLNISRTQFDRDIIFQYKKSPQKMQFIGAPESTLSIKKGKKLKGISFSNDSILELSANPVYGLNIENKTYYYIHFRI